MPSCPLIFIYNPYPVYVLLYTLEEKLSVGYTPLMMFVSEREEMDLAWGYELKREFHFCEHLFCLAILQSCITSVIKKN